MGIRSPFLKGSMYVHDLKFTLLTFTNYMEISLHLIVLSLGENMTFVHISLFTVTKEMLFPAESRGLLHSNCGLALSFPYHTSVSSRFVIITAF